MGLLDARSGPHRIFGEEGPVNNRDGARYRRAHLSRVTFSFRNRLAMGCRCKAAHRSGEGSRQRFIGSAHPADEAPSGPRPQKRVQINRQLRSFFLCGHLTPLSRTLVSTRESIPFRVPPSSQCFQGGKPAFLKIAPLRASLKFHGRGFHQTTTIGPAGLHCCLDYAGGAAGGGESEVGSG